MSAIHLRNMCNWWVHPLPISTAWLHETSCMGKLMGSHSRLNKVSISKGDGHLIKMTTILTTPIQPCIRRSIVGSVGLRHIYLNWSACYTPYKCMKQLLIIYKSLSVKFLWITILIYICFHNTLRGSWSLSWSHQKTSAIDHKLVSSHKPKDTVQTSTIYHK